MNRLAERERGREKKRRGRKKRRRSEEKKKRALHRIEPGSTDTYGNSSRYAYNSEGVSGRYSKRALGEHCIVVCDFNVHYQVFIVDVVVVVIVAAHRRILLPVRSGTERQDIL